MAVNDQIDLIFLQHAEVDLCAERDRCSEQDVLQLGRDHGTAPAVCKGRSRCLSNQVFVFLIDTDTCAVEHLDDFAIDATWHDPPVAPALLALLRWTRSSGLCLAFC